MLARTGNTGSAPLADRGHDFYETPAVAVRALLEAERLPQAIWEPACGRGAIALPLAAAGHTVWASDLLDCGLPGAAKLNFLAATSAPAGVQAVVTNPPYKDAGEFVRRALDLVPFTAMLLRLAFLESEGRTDVLDGGRLARVHVFKNRLPRMHRDGWTGPKSSSSAMAFAWFVWDRSHRGAPTIHRIRWR